MKVRIVDIHHTSSRFYSYNLYVGFTGELLLDKQDLCPDKDYFCGSVTADHDSTIRNRGFILYIAGFKYEEI